MKYLLPSLFTLFVVWLSVHQSLIYSRPDRFILATARLAQVPTGQGQTREDGPSALLDGEGYNQGKTSYMPYPLGNPENNYFWIELAVSHRPYLDDRDRSNESATTNSGTGSNPRVQVATDSGPHSPHADDKWEADSMPTEGSARKDEQGLRQVLLPASAGQIRGPVRIIYEPYVPHRIRIWNGPCDTDRRELTSRDRVSPLNGSRPPLLEIQRARMDFYYRPLNDPDQDFGYPESTHQASYEISFPEGTHSLDFPLSLPGPEESQRYPENMYMIILKLSILEVRPVIVQGESTQLVAERKQESQDTTSPGQKGTLALCEVMYADRPYTSDFDSHFFVFW